MAKGKLYACGRCYSPELVPENDSEWEPRCECGGVMHEVECTVAVGDGPPAPVQFDIKPAAKVTRSRR